MNTTQTAAGPARAAQKLMEVGRIVARQVGMILLALALACVFLACSGYPPFAVLQGVWQSLTSDIAGTVRWATPLILAGLAMCVTQKAQVFNLGADGQIYLGAAAATAVAMFVPFPNPVVALLCVLLAAAVAGMLYALIPALLKVYLDVNEIVSTLLFNFIALLFIEFLVSGPLRDRSAGANLNASPVLPENTWLPRISFLEPSSANVGFYLAIAAALVLVFVFRKTALGYEIKIVGSNAFFAAYGGIKPRRTTIQVMCLSGGLAGLIGAIEVCAVQHRLLAGFNPDYGFDGIVVALLANNNPLGAIFSGAFFGALKNGGTNMERLTEVPSAVTKIVMAIVILTISAQFAAPHIRRWLQGRKATKGGA